ncbi:hypothetical protein ACFRFL_45235 [Streptomyces sp. NPDC056708]|uniref:hypothetical protein n=1 Tax=unclassified Streptomyces TaxID=2593676 RepID=UPI00369C27A9
MAAAEGFDAEHRQVTRPYLTLTELAVEDGGAPADEDEAPQEYATGATAPVSV